MFRSRIFVAFLPLFLVIAACNRTDPKPSIDQPLGLGADSLLSRCRPRREARTLS